MSPVTPADVIDRHSRVVLPFRTAEVVCACGWRAALGANVHVDGSRLFAVHVAGELERAGLRLTVAREFAAVTARMVRLELVAGELMKLAKAWQASVVDYELRAEDYDAWAAANDRVEAGYELEREIKRWTDE
ncbi:hypothetical protein [Tomitella gaofuii]|uniref:hypothetical protein n=1 Tax=Tomitella gaofuii TaxID=2760083 RepID=UPI0015F7A274|nr:hypothetical protein [Tomitella gaofuii]